MLPESRGEGAHGGEPRPRPRGARLIDPDDVRLGEKRGQRTRDLHQATGRTGFDEQSRGEIEPPRPHCRWGGALHWRNSEAGDGRAACASRGHRHGQISVCRWRCTMRAAGTPSSAWMNPGWSPSSTLRRGASRASSPRAEYLRSPHPAPCADRRPPRRSPAPTRLSWSCPSSSMTRAAPTTSVWMPARAQPPSRPAPLVSCETTLPVGTTRTLQTPHQEVSACSGPRLRRGVLARRVLTGPCLRRPGPLPEARGSCANPARRGISLQTSCSFDRDDLPRPNGVWPMGGEPSRRNGQTRRNFHLSRAST